MAIEIRQKQAKQWKLPRPDIDLNNLFDTKPDTRDRIFFTEQLSLLLETGTALHAALQSLSSLATKASLRRIIEQLASDVEEGRSFSSALERHPDFFNKAYVNLIAAAETGGFLDSILAELKDMDEKRETLKSRVSTALIYPGFLLAFSLAVVIFVLTIVFPKFADLFIKIADELPASTRILMAASNALINHWMLISLVVIAAISGLVYWARTSRGKLVIDRMKLSSYLVKDIFIRLYLVQSLRLMSLSLGNGVTVMDTLEACKEAVENSEYTRFMLKLQDKVTEGSGFAAGFAEQDFIPPTVKQMIKTGDDSGNLHHVMNRIADYYEAELQKRLDMFTRLVEPVMLLVMGGVVGIIVSSLILPIFKLSRAVG